MNNSNYRLDIGDERLWNGSQPVQITNKAFELLRFFVTNPNRLLTKDHILQVIWGDVCVSEGLIREYVHDLRLALGDDLKQPRFIETVRGRGYRYLGGIDESGEPAGAVWRRDPHRRGAECTHMTLAVRKLVISVEIAALGSV